ncbi:hypothetical protein BSL78_16433 [Apostichopus japonicus]|uniref:CCHC-type domain-containing protein n=1 Tax=Stichopus japonicus TaxID=307972 RepID=A0A2G8KFE9_STIJA|nr:hypothetical protein BSL78_16433 [Apostichopus japonicus]
MSTPGVNSGTRKVLKKESSHNLQFEQQVDKGKEWNKNKKCYNCSDVGHVSRDCKKHRGTYASKGRSYDRGAGLSEGSDSKAEVKERAAACQTDSELLVGEDNVKHGLPKVSVLRDTGCTTVVARRKFVDPSKFTGANKRCVLLDGTVRDVSVAVIAVDTPFYQGEVEALVMESPLYDLILGNINGVRNHRTQTRIGIPLNLKVVVRIQVL